MSYYLPKISLFSDSISIREAKGINVKGFDYQEFVLADSVRVLLENYSSYVNLHNVGEFFIFKKQSYSEWNKRPTSYMLLENPGSLGYEYHILDWNGWGHKVYGKSSTYEVIPIEITGKKMSIDIKTATNRIVLLLKDSVWTKVDPDVFDALYALEY